MWLCGGSRGLFVVVTGKAPTDKSTMAAGCCGCVRLVKRPECGAVRKLKRSCSCQAGLSGQAPQTGLLHANKEGSFGGGLLARQPGRKQLK